MSALTHDEIPRTILQPTYQLSFDNCAYCGTAVVTTRDHPIPRGLYPNSERGRYNFLTIPACRSCNDAKSQVDNALRDYLVTNIRTSEHPLAKETFEDTFERAVTSNRVKLLDQFHKGREVNLITERGIWSGVGYAAPVNLEPVESALKWMVRGLHWAAFDEVVHPEGAYTRFLSDSDIVRAIEALKVGKIHGAYTQGDVFTCGWEISPKGHVIWVIVFYGKDMFAGRTATSKFPIEHEDQEDQPDRLEPSIM